MPSALSCAVAGLAPRPILEELRIGLPPALPLHLSARSSGGDVPFGLGLEEAAAAGAVTAARLAGLGARGLSLPRDSGTRAGIPAPAEAACGERAELQLLPRLSGRTWSGGGGGGGSSARGARLARPSPAELSLVWQQEEEEPAASLAFRCTKGPVLQPAYALAGGGSTAARRLLPAPLGCSLRAATALAP